MVVKTPIEWNTEAEQWLDSDVENQTRKSFTRRTVLAEMRTFGHRSFELGIRFALDRIARDMQELTNEYDDWYFTDGD